jgi:putative ATP-dependent endonuclease of OLD family
MARLKQIRIENYKSIKEEISVNFPENNPVVLIGENNSGKSNITRAIDLIFGEFHPKFQKLDDHDHNDRNPSNEINIVAEVGGYEERLGKNGEYTCEGFTFSSKDGNNEFLATQDDGKTNPYITNPLRSELQSIVVNAERSLSYQLSYSSKFTLLSKVTKRFHSKLSEHQDVVDELKNLFEQITTTFLKVPEFSNFRENMSSMAGHVITNMAYGLELDFTSYDPSNYFRALGVNPTENGETRSFEELGTGQQQILALSFAHAYSKSFLSENLILIIDEPEAHLHPLAQKWLARTMFDMAGDGLQIVLTSHSPHFINLEFLEGIKLIRKDEDGTDIISKSRNDLLDYCLRTNSDPQKTTNETIIPFYASHSTPNILNGFFANKIVLVEGPTEELALPVYLKKVGLDVLKEGVEVINVTGKNNLAKWWRLFTLYEIPTFMCFDNDSKKGRDALKAINLPDEEIEELLTEANWNINEKFCVFGKDFEQNMRSTITNYEEVENEVSDYLGDSKHITAREVAERLEVTKDEGWENFKALAIKIQELQVDQAE